MNILRLLPVLVSFLVLAAHFLRSGNVAVVALCLALPLVLLVRRPWAARVVQLALLLGGLEWIRTLVALASHRQAMGEAWIRMAVILGAVGLVTLLSALVFRARALRERYRL
jgi:hypothetical protein